MRSSSSAHVHERVLELGEDLRHAGMGGLARSLFGPSRASRVAASTSVSPTVVLTPTSISTSAASHSDGST